MNKILIHSIVFSPDGVSTAYLFNDIALKFKEKGYEVVVLTTTPHYNVIDAELKKQPQTAKFGGLFYESNFNGIRVRHVPQKKYKSTILRMMGFVYWHIMSLILGLFEKNIDIILSPSPPLTIGFINILIGKLKGAKVIYNIQEIYPDLLIEGGGLKSKGIISILKWLEKFVYNRSDKATTIDKIFYDTIVTRFKDQSKLHIIPNFVDTAIYKPLDESKLEIDRNYFPVTDALKLMYAGNIGHAQDWEPLLKIADQLKKENIEFFIIGEGAMKGHIEKEVARLGLDKVHLLPYQPRELMPSLIAYADLQFIFMSPQTEGHGFPSKVYTIMACAKPMLVCSGPNTPIINFLENKNCAYLVEEKDLYKKTARLVNILNLIDRNQLKGMGINGHKEINQNYSKDAVTEMYVKLAESLL